MTPSENSLLADRYELDEQIGAGASALTWRARDTRLGRIVAVKILRPALAGDPGYAQRFEREAQLAASISHPNVVDVYDVGRDDGQLYIIMQYVDGEDLKHLIAREGRLSPDRAVAVAQQILDGLAAIHRAGIIHRDIKPQNVLIGSDGTARVTDFGVAHLDAGEGLTSTGAAIGTAAYMAPEQAAGGDISEATDIYAAGVVLYEMLTGQLPFTGPTPMAIMLAHMQQPVVAPSHVAPGASISSALDGVVLQAMAKAPVNRFRTARAMNQALAGAQRAGPSSIPTQRLSAPRASQPTRPVSRPVRPVPRSTPSRSSNSSVAPTVPAVKRGRSWIPALLIALLLVAALAAGGYIARNGLSGHGAGDGATVPAVVDATATQTMAMTPTPPAASVEQPTQPLAPTETQPVIVPLRPTEALAIPTPTTTDTPVSAQPPTQPPIVPSTNQNGGANKIVPATNAAIATRQAAGFLILVGNLVDGQHTLEMASAGVSAGRSESSVNGVANRASRKPKSSHGNGPGAT